MNNHTKVLPDFRRPHTDAFEINVVRVTHIAARSFLAACAILTALALGAGCASKNSKQPPSRPREGIAEYRQLTAEAEHAMQAALAALAKVSAQSIPCPPEVLTAFSNEVCRVQVDSLRVRARSQAMLARGDAYFESWEENLARIDDPAVRTLAKQQHQALHDGFLKVKMWSREAHEAFQPFLAGLRRVRNALEKDPASLSAESTRANIASARTSGKEVEGSLDNIRRELDSMISMLTPAGNAPQSQ
jgi:hypothetical protein